MLQRAEASPNIDCARSSSYQDTLKKVQFLIPTPQTPDPTYFDRANSRQTSRRITSDLPKWQNHLSTQHLSKTPTSILHSQTAWRNHPNKHPQNKPQM
jgi:hypothetical protein